MKDVQEHGPGWNGRDATSRGFATRSPPAARVARSRPSGFRWSLPLAAALLGGAFFLACDASLGSQEGGDLLGFGRFGPEDRLAAAIEPGRFLGAEDVEETLEVHVQAVSPTAHVVLDNGSARPVLLRLRADDLLVDGVLARRLEPLPEGARRELACADGELAPAMVEVAPLRPSREPPARLWADVLLPACTRVVLTPLRDQRDAVWRTLVVPPETPPRRVVEALDASVVTIDHVLFLGGQTTSRGSDPLGPFLDARQSLDKPITWVADPRRSNERSDDVVRRWGPGSFMLRVEDARVLVLETSRAGLRGAARELVDGLAPEPWLEDVAIMAVPPALPDVPDRESFDRQGAASRLIEDLAEAGFRKAIVLAGQRSYVSSFGPLTWHISPMNGAASSNPGAWRVIEIHGARGQGRPCNTVSACGPRERCEAGRCRDTCTEDGDCAAGSRCHLAGICTPRCNEDTTCAPLGSLCIEGGCAPLPVVRVRDFASLAADAARREVELESASD